MTDHDSNSITSGSPSLYHQSSSLSASSAEGKTPKNDAANPDTDRGVWECGVRLGVSVHRLSFHRARRQDRTPGNTLGEFPHGPRDVWRERRAASCGQAYRPLRGKIIIRTSQPGSGDRGGWILIVSHQGKAEPPRLQGWQLLRYARG